MVGFARRWPAACLRSAAAWAIRSRSCDSRRGDLGAHGLGLLLERRDLRLRALPARPGIDDAGQAGLDLLDAREDLARRASAALPALGRLPRPRQQRLRPLQEVPPAPLDRRDLALQAGELGLHGGLLGAQRRGLALEVGLLGLEAGLLLQQLGLLGLQRGGLLLQRGLLRLALLLLLLELGLERLGLVLLLLHRRVGRGGRVQVDPDQQRAVVAHAEAVGEEVVGLALGGVRGRRADVLLPELQREDRDREDAERDDRGRDRDQRVAGDGVAPLGPEARAGLLRAWAASTRAGAPSRCAAPPGRASPAAG